MRIGKNINVDDPIYMLDKNRGFFRLPTLQGSYIELQSVKYKNRDAYDNHYFNIIIGGETYRIQKDELLAGLQYV